MTNSNKDVL